MGKPITQFCSKCRKRKPIKGFNIKRGICADCGKSLAAEENIAPSRKRRSRLDPGPKSWRCPNSLQRVHVKDSALAQHKNAAGSICRGSGHELRQRSRDAFDYRGARKLRGRWPALTVMDVLARLHVDQIKEAVSMPAENVQRSRGTAPVSAHFRREGVRRQRSWVGKPLLKHAGHVDTRDRA